MDAFFENQVLLRSVFSLGGLLLFWGLSLLIPFRRSVDLRSPRRWVSNLIFSFGNGLLIRILIPLTLVQLASSQSFTQLKLLQLPVDNVWVQTFWGVLILDFALYWQHRFTHRIRPLWLLHRVHHSDIEFDTTTAGRFHTLEIAFSFFVKATFVILFGLSPVSVLIFEILLNFSALFNHSNFCFPPSVEKILRFFIVTPSLHRIHHSTHHEEMNQNFGFSITLWDRLFATYLNQNKENQQDMKIGLQEFRQPHEQTFYALLTQPFLRGQNIKKNPPITNPEMTKANRQ